MKEEDSLTRWTTTTMMDMTRYNVINMRMERVLANTPYPPDSNSLLTLSELVMSTIKKNMSERNMSMMGTENKSQGKIVYEQYLVLK